MNEILRLIIALGIAVITNIALGMYYKIGKQKFAFDWKVFLSGVIKGVIVGGSFISIAYVIELSQVLVEEAPIAILLAGVSLYLAKCILQLKDILGIAKAKKEM